ncbi:MAG: HupE/UreJ family protein [Candidatus Marinimicrobia bacterium]|nr:HupE/UreJ family protein [Candidatus Neomarinimicrobiota bacterium]
MNNLFTLKNILLVLAGTVFLFAGTPDAMAHGVTQGDKGFIQESSGTMIVPFIYLGAKHMVTGYDHLLFLFGVIFFLYRLKDVSIYVTLFALGHSVTLLSGVLLNISVNAYIIDAVIGFSIVYKALDNMGAYQSWFGIQPNTKVATLIFGLFHGFGLATKILDYKVSSDGLIPNLISFNVGVELGQIMGLAIILIIMGYWRRSIRFMDHAYNANVLLMAGGFIFVGYQLTGFFTS